MTKKKKEDHVHKYYRVKLGKHIVYKCALTACPNYLRKELVIGRLSLCWKCGATFPMTKGSVTLLYPHCIACTRTKSRENIDAIKQFLENGGME